VDITNRKLHLPFLLITHLLLPPRSSRNSGLRSFQSPQHNSTGVGGGGGVRDGGGGDVKY
jgi:hypothetical protein